MGSPGRERRTAPETASRPTPERSCVGCRQVKTKSELVRLVAVEGQVIASPGRRAGGRGAYLCRDGHCWEVAERRRALDRALRLTLTAEDWRRLREGILS